jgi:hypothetical protein
MGGGIDIGFLETLEDGWLLNELPSALGWIWVVLAFPGRCERDSV